MPVYCAPEALQQQLTSIFAVGAETSTLDACDAQTATFRRVNQHSFELPTCVVNSYKKLETSCRP